MSETVKDRCLLLIISYRIMLWLVT